MGTGKSQMCSQEGEHHPQEFFLKKADADLAGVAQWIACWPVNHGVTGSIPSRGTCLGCRPGPHLGACKRQQINVSLTH